MISHLFSMESNPTEKHFYLVSDEETWLSACVESFLSPIFLEISPELFDDCIADAKAQCKRKHDELNKPILVLRMRGEKGFITPEGELLID